MQLASYLSICIAVVDFLGLAAANKRWKLVWNDEFDGNEVDETKWSFLLGDGCSINLCGWGNNEKQWYTNSRENAFIENGHLVIQAKQRFEKTLLPGITRLFSSARLVTKGKGDWKFGRIEVTAKFASGRGVWPLIWMLPSYRKYGVWPNSGEIDIAVMPAPDTLYTQVIFGRNYKDFMNPKKSPPGDDSFFTEDFHNFVVLWEKDRITWLIDGIVVHNFSKADAISIENYPFNEKFHIVLNLAVGGNVVGSPSSSLFPRRLEVDYIRVFQYL